MDSVCKHGYNISCIFGKEPSCEGCPHATQEKEAKMATSVFYDDGYLAALVDLQGWFGTPGRGIMPGKKKLNERIISLLLSEILANWTLFQTKKHDFDVIAFPPENGKGDWKFRTVATKEDCIDVMWGSKYLGELLFRKQIADIKKETENGKRD